MLIIINQIYHLSLRYINKLILYFYSQQVIMIKFIQYIQKSLPFTYELYLLRQQLNSEPQFVPYELFKYIDNYTNGQITKSDIQKFFKFDPKSVIPQLLVKLMSKDKKDSVKYMDFYHFLTIQVSKSNIHFLNPRIQIKKKKIKQIIKQIFLKEVEYLSSILQTKKKLQLYTFNQIYLLFTKLDQKKIQLIDANNFAIYLKEYHDQEISEEILNIFLKREFKSNTITFCQFYEFFQNSKKLKKFQNILKKKVEEEVHNLTPKKKEKIMIRSDFESTMKKKTDQKNKNKGSRSLLKKGKNNKINQTEKQITKYQNTLISYLGKIQVSKQIKDIKKSCSKYLKYKN